MIKTIITSLATALIVSVLALSYAPKVSITDTEAIKEVLGSTIETVKVAFGGGIQVSDRGTAGTTYTLIKSGTCTLLGDNSIAATSTGNVDCAVTGARSGDLVRLNLAASTSIASQFVVKAVQASSTANYITAQLVNLTGAARVPSSVVGFGSSTQYQIFRSTSY